MLARVHSAATLGLEARVLDVEVDASDGFPRFTIVGLPDASVREARERVRAALKNGGFPFPGGAVTVNLAPADFRKCGAALDFPVAVGLLWHAGVRSVSPVRRVFVGELGLGGEVRAVRGALCLALAARDAGFEEIVLPASCALEASAVGGIRVVPVGHLSEAVEHLLGTRPIPFLEPSTGLAPPPLALADFAEVRGQAVARRAAEIAAAGGHHLLLTGPPGAGKTMLARRLPGILPPLSRSEAIEVTRIHSVAGALPHRSGPARGGAFPCAAPRYLLGVPDRRRHAALPRRDLARAPGRSLPRRAPRVSPRRSRGDPPASRRAAGPDRARQRRLRLSLRRASRGRDEPVSLRLSGRPAAVLRLRPARAVPVCPSRLGTAARSDRSAHLGRRGGLEGSGQPRRRGAFGGDPLARLAGSTPRGSAPARLPGFSERGPLCTGTWAARRSGRGRKETSRGRVRAPAPVRSGTPPGAPRGPHDRRSRIERADKDASPRRGSFLSRLRSRRGLPG